MSLNKSVRNIIRRIPLVGIFLKKVYGLWIADRLKFTDSGSYWENRYKVGLNSGVGSYGLQANFKAEYINNIVSSLAIESVIEFGCGDGNQLSLSLYPSYQGYDISNLAVATCREKFRRDSSKSFANTMEYDGRKADLSISLDVLYHLVENEVFDVYMRKLFVSSTKYVIIYSTNSTEISNSPHVKHRKFTDWIEVNEPKWKLIDVQISPWRDRSNIATGDFYPDFYLFELSDEV